MAIFRSLSSIIQEQINTNAIKEHVHPSITETAELVGQNIKYSFNTNTPSSIEGVFKWGFSTWGSDTIIGIKFPEDLQ